MLRWDGFARSLAFALVAAAGLPGVLTFAPAGLGPARVLELYVLAAAVAYSAGVGPRRRTTLGAAALGAAGLAALPLGLVGTALGAALLVALCRSGLQQRQRPLRALAVELLLGVLGLGAATFLASGGLRGLALAVWGYFLVQSAYFLIGGRSQRRPSPSRDPFEQARIRLGQIWGEEGLTLR